MSDVFASLEALLLDGESLDFKISRSRSTLTVLLIPQLAAAATALSPEATQARAALSYPLRLEMTGAELDADFERRVRGFATQRQALRDSYELLMSELNEANKVARSKVGDKATRAGTAATAAAPRSEAPRKPGSTPAQAPAEAPCIPSNRSETVPDMTQPMSLFNSPESAK